MKKYRVSNELLVRAERKREKLMGYLEINFMEMDVSEMEQYQKMISAIDKAHDNVNDSYGNYFTDGESLSILNSCLL